MVLPLLTRLDHVGIACRDLRRAIDMYRETFGLGVLSLEENEEQGVREAMLAVGPAGAGPGSLGVGYIQLLEPLSPDTPVGRFIARRGEGIHHVGYGVANIEEALATVAGDRYQAGRRAAQARVHGSLDRLPAPGRSGGRADRTRTAAELSVDAPYCR
jgi:methylmalonyl-CoA/ethylmalonyl-CoA epimerase